MYIPNGQYVYFDQPSTGNALTYEAIVRFDSFPNDHEAFVLRRRGHFQDHSFYASRMEDPDSPGTYRRYMVFDLAEEGTYPGYHVHSPIPVETGIWYHVAGSYDGQVMRLYQDEIESYDPANPTLVAENAVVFDVGWGHYGEGFGAYRGTWIGHGQDFYYGFDGAIDELRISSVALTQFAEYEKRTLLYRGLGDSVASGHGLPDESEFCRRAPGAYPELVPALLLADGAFADKYDAIGSINLACSMVATKKDHNDDLSFEEQVEQAIIDIDAIRENNPETDVLVSITIGANNFDFVREIVGFQDFKAPGHNFCQEEKQFDDWVARTIGGAIKDLSYAVESLTSRERVYVVLTEYHNAFNERSALLSWVLNFNKKCQRWLKGLPPNVQLANMYERTESIVRALNSSVHALAASGPFPAARVGVAEVYQDFHGHDSRGLLGCEIIPLSPGDAWVQSFPDCFHPNPTGAGQFAQSVQQAALKLLIPPDP